MVHEVASRPLVTCIFAALWAVMLIFAAPSFAQEDQYDCASFGSQESAQAELERDPSDPSNLDADDDGIACEDYDYGGTGAGTQGADSGGDLDCADFATQAEAQAEFNADPTDPNGLDADDDGKACEELAGGSEAQQGGGNADKQYGKVINVTVVKGKLPGTGGPSLVLLLGPLAIALVGMWLLIARRR